MHTSFFGFQANQWIYVFLILLAIIGIVVYLNFPSAYNQGLYHYQGLVMKEGGLPYTDFIEKKGPMGLLTYSLASLLFGESAMAYRFFDLIILAITGIYLYRFVRLSHVKLTATFVSTVWFSHVIIDGPGNTADVTNIITACFVILAYHLLAPRKKNYFLIIGVFVALACWVKPTAILIAAPVILLFFNRRIGLAEPLKGRQLLLILIGMSIPSIIFMPYLFLSGTFQGFWEAVVLDPLLNYAGDVSRFSLRTLLKTAFTISQDPIFRIGGMLALLFLATNKTARLARILVIGIAIMLFVEGRFYPYHYSILWPFLCFGLVHGMLVLAEKWKAITQKIVLVLLCFVSLLPTALIAGKFANAGGLTANYYPGDLFLFPDFKEMYDFRQPVVRYLKKHKKEMDEILVLGRDPNIYLELETITTCRLAREGHMLIGDNSRKTPEYLVSWQKELISYMLDQKADWIILLKELEGKWLTVYANDMELIFTEKYKMVEETSGHFIYQKRNR